MVTISFPQFWDPFIVSLCVTLDIHCLLANDHVQGFIGTEDYEKRKEKRFPTADVRHIADNEAFLIRDLKVRELYMTE